MAAVPLGTQDALADLVEALDGQSGTRLHERSGTALGRAVKRARTVLVEGVERTPTPSGITDEPRDESLGLWVEVDQRDGPRACDLLCAIGRILYEPGENGRARILVKAPAPAAGDVERVARVLAFRYLSWKDVDEWEQTTEYQRVLLLDDARAALAAAAGSSEGHTLVPNEHLIELATSRDPHDALTDAALEAARGGRPQWPETGGAA
ncbi:MAG: hypothetical protein ABW167_05180 [Baekduia sp.]